MLTIYEINPEGYAEKIFTGSTLEEFLDDVKSYFKEWDCKDDEELLEIILGQAREAYKGDYEYVYCNEAECFALCDDELRAEVESIILGECLDVFNMDDAEELLKYYYGEDNVSKIEVVEFKYYTSDSRCIGNIEEFKATLEEMGAEIVYSEKYQVCDFIGVANAEKMLVVNLKLLAGNSEFYTYQQISEILNSKYNLNELTKEEYLEIANFLDSEYCISSGIGCDTYTKKQVIYIKDMEDYCNKLYEYLQYDSLEEFEEDKEDIDEYWKGEGLYDFWEGNDSTMDYYMKLEDCVNLLLEIKLDKDNVESI